MIYVFIIFTKKSAMKNIFKIGYSIIFLLLIIVSCKKETPQEDPNFKPATSAYNVSYGPEPEQSLDIRLPENRSIDSTKILVFIHGGNWTSGNKTNINVHTQNFINELPKYAIISLNYRLFSNDPYKNEFPTQELDVKLALDFIKSKTTSWDISNDITLVGIDAGAHLALIQAYKHNTDQTIKAVGAFSPITNLAEGFDNPQSIKTIIEQITGGTPSEKPLIYAESSPINYLSTSIPTILIHGATNELIPITQSIALKDSLTNLGKPVEFISIPNQGNLIKPAQYTDAIKKIGLFFKEHNP